MNTVNEFTDEPVEFNAETLGWYSEFVHAREQIKKWTEIAERARQVLESALGDSTLGTINGQPVIRWGVVTSKRFDVKKARELLPAELITALEVETHTRRFDVVDHKERM